MDNGVEPTAMDESAERLEDEVRRTVEQAKELRDAASSLVAKSSSEEQSIRQRAASLDSTLRRLRSSIDSQLRRNLLDPQLSDKARSLIFSISFALSFLIVTIESRMWRVLSK